MYWICHFSAVWLGRVEQLGGELDVESDLASRSGCAFSGPVISDKTLSFS